MKPVMVYVVDPDDVGAPLKTPDVELKLIPGPGEGSTEYEVMAPPVEEISQVTG